jgi:glutaredoxin 3
MKITIYSTKTCGYCHILKNWLDEKSIKYTDYSVDINPIAAQNMINISGQMGVPFTVIEKDDGQTVKILGFDKPKFESELSTVA